MSAFFLRKHSTFRKALSALNVLTISLTMVLGGIPFAPFVGSVRPALAALPTEIQVTTDTATQGQPRIDGGRIVYSDNRNAGAGYDIYMYDKNTGVETRITTNTSNQSYPDISGDLIVYQDDRFGNDDIFVYDLVAETETRITTDGANQQRPGISGNNIVWKDFRNGNADIYRYEIGGAESRITTTSMTFRAEPAISGDNIVWNEWRPNWDIYTHNISSGIQRRLTTDTAHQYYSDIDGDKVVYLDNRAGGAFSIYMYNLTLDTETLITTNTGANSYPAISGSKIVWQNAADNDIFMYDLDTSSQRQLTTNGSPQFAPDVADGVAVWQDDRNGNSDIYMLELDSVPVTTILADGAPPSGDWYTTTPTISLTPDETATTHYSWDGFGSETTYTGPLPAPAGDNVLSYYSVGTNGRSEGINNQEFKVDTGAPIDPELMSPTHATDTPSNNNAIQIDIAGATDAVSGVEGYSGLWSLDSTTPPPVVNMAASGGSDTTTSADLPDGEWWFNLSTKDTAGNWTNTAHIGPFTIDTSAPAAYFVAPAGGDNFIRPQVVELSGAAADNAGGGGLADTRLTIRRLVDGAYWDGFGWGGPADISLGSGSLWDYAVPAGALGQDGTYMASVSAEDLAGNVQPGPSIITFNYLGGSVSPSTDLRVLTLDSSDVLAARVVRASATATDPAAPDLFPAGYTAGTTLTVELNVGSRSALSVLAHGEPVGWSQTGSTVTVEARTIAYKPTTSTPGFELSSALEFLVQFTGDPQLQDSWFASNASEQNVPAPDLSDLNSLRMQVTGIGGVSGWAEAFIPAATMATWGVADPDLLSVEIDGVEGTPTLAPVEGGQIMKIELGYSTHVLRYGKDRVIPTGSVSINAGAVDTSSTTVSLTLSATDGVGSGVAQMRFAETTAALAGAFYQSYNTTAAFNLSAGDGVKTVYAQYKDAAGNESTPANDAINLDTTGPTGTFVIDSGDTYTNNPVVDLGISSPDAALMRFAETTANLPLAVYHAYNTTDAIVLTGGDGPSPVFAQFMDSLGNESTVTISDSIILDTGVPTDPPALSSTSHTTGTPSNNNTIDIAFSGATDALSGIDGYSFDWTLNSTAAPNTTVDTVASNNLSTLVAGYGHTVGLRQDGTVVAVGRNDMGETSVTGWSGINTIAAGGYHTVGLKANATVVAEGNNNYGQTNVSSWTGIKAIAAGGNHTVGLKADGTVMATGWNDYGQTNVSSWTGIKAVAAGAYHTVGLKADGTVVAEGENSYNQTNVSSWTGIKAVAAGRNHTVGLRADGTVVAAGQNDAGQTDVSSWTGITAIAAGWRHTVGLKSDGTVVATGDNSYNQTNVSSWTSITAIAAGMDHTVGLRADSGVEAVGNNDYGQTGVGSWSNIKRSDYMTTSPDLADGNWYFNLRTKDNAGNWTSTAHLGPFVIDTAAPTGSVSINSGAARTNTGAVTLSLDATDTNGSGVAWMSFSNDGVTWSTRELYSTTKAWVLSAGDGNRTVWARFIDSADNTSAAVSDTIFKDTAAPTATMTAPKFSTNVSKTKSFTVSWNGADAAPSSGIAAYDVQVKTNATGAWTTWKANTALKTAVYTGIAGNTYYFKARAKDNAANTGAYSAEAKTIVPYDNVSLITKRVGFTGVISKATSNYYLGTVRYSTTKGDELTYTFTGNYFALIGSKGPKFSKAVITIDGIAKTIEARAAANSFRQVLLEKALVLKKHTVKIKNLGTAGRTRFEVDGLGVGR